MRLIPLLILAWASVSWAGDGVHPFRQGKKFGYVDSSGAVVVEAKFDWAWPLTEGRAGVRQGRNWYLVGETLERVGEIRCDWIGPFCGGLAPAREGKLWGFIDRNGKWVVKPYYSDVRPFRQGVVFARRAKTSPCPCVPQPFPPSAAKPSPNPPEAPGFLSHPQIRTFYPNAQDEARRCFLPLPARP